jgi:hypothetical protein
MFSSNRPRTLAAAALPLLLTTACAADLGGDAEGLEDLEVVTGALTSVNNTLDANGFKTDFGAQVAIGGATDHVLAVWVGKTASNVPQIVGQSFAATGNQIGQVFGGVGRKLLAFSNTTRAKSSPAMAWDSSGNDKFLVVWQDDYSATDSDIWGAIIDDKGDLIPLPNGKTNPFTINYDGDSEKTPAVTFVRDVNSYLVTYTRKLSGRTALSAQWVDAAGVASGLFDVIQSGVDQTFRPSVAYCRFQNIMMFTWNDNMYTFGDTNYPTGPQNLVGTTIAGAKGLVAAAAAAPSATKKYALAWLEGNNDTAVIKGRTLSQGCFSAACATTTTLIPAKTNGSTNLFNPVIAPAGMGFAVYAGSEQNPRRIKYASFGGATGSSASVTADCAGALQSVGGRSLGSSGGVIAAAGLPNVQDETTTRSFLLYDSYCQSPSTYPKEMVSAVKPTDTTDIVSFNVSTNGL